MPYVQKSEVRDGMRIDWNVPIQVRDGHTLYADVFRPVAAGHYPVILSHGPYGKGLAFQYGYKTAWSIMAEKHPDVTAGSTNKYQNWEVVDPEKWVPHGYAVVRVDSRGAGASPGYMALWSPQETSDMYDCIEWSGVQDWSNGKVGLNGISYYGMNQWQVAALQPPHLAAICIWEGASDFYRDLSHHGGILCDFIKNWYDMQVKSVQYGLGKNGPINRITGEFVCGMEELSPEQLLKNRENLSAEVAKHALDDAYWKARTPDFSKIKAPLLSAANWGGQGLHPRGNFEGYLRSASTQKWLEVHGIEHWTEFYTDYGRKIQLKFFDYFLRGKKNGWDKQPKVQLQVRHPGEKFVQRVETEWPLARTQWTPMYLNGQDMTLQTKKPEKLAKQTYQGFSDGVTFMLPPSDKDTEITGPLALKLFASSSTQDADFFAVVRVFSPDMKEVVFIGALDPHTPVGQGWLRASHRKLDTKLSKPYRPYHPHDEVQLLTPGKVYEFDIEIVPTCIVIPAGHRLAVTVRGKDYEYPGPATHLSNMKYPMTGCGPFTHTDPKDRPAKVFDGNVTIFTGGARASYLLAPVIPAAKKASAKKATVPKAAAKKATAKKSPSKASSR
ncbi:MAG: CocE/NonD family hydrolase [Alphaproteobacteria bacterium]|nr:CocE/NonD family hydrolase [Alphaproteobacteria bacterium]